MSDYLYRHPTTRRIRRIERLKRIVDRSVPWVLAFGLVALYAFINDLSVSILLLMLFAFPFAVIDVLGSDHE